MTVKTTDTQQSQSYGNFYGAVLEILTDFLIMDDVDLIQLFTIKHNTSSSKVIW